MCTAPNICPFNFTEVSQSIGRQKESQCISVTQDSIFPLYSEQDLQTHDFFLKVLFGMYFGMYSGQKYLFPLKKKFLGQKLVTVALLWQGFQRATFAMVSNCNDT